MRSLLILLLLVCSTASAGDWWKKSSHSLPDLFNMGYEVINFSVVHESHTGMIDSVEQDAYRYLLKRTRLDVTKPNNQTSEWMLCVKRENTGSKSNGTCYSSNQ